jgi:hypothetical protein
MHTYIHAYIHAYMKMNTCTHMNYTYICAYKYACTHELRIHAHMNIDTNTYTYTCTPGWFYHKNSERNKARASYFGANFTDCYAIGGCDNSVNSTECERREQTCGAYSDVCK